jgi:hypothetical protein
MTNLFDKMQEIDTYRNPVFTAVEKLDSDSDIKQFVIDYTNYIIKERQDITPEECSEIARSNIGYILGYYTPDIRTKWYALLPDVSHPIFGSQFGRT